MKKTLLLLFIFILCQINFANAQSYSNLRGRILLQVEDKGQAWYVNPADGQRAFLGRPSDAFGVMRGFGVGISDNDLKKIPINVSAVSGDDNDNDGLPNNLEIAIGTDINKKDTDNDGYSDKEELEAGYDFSGSGRLPIDTGFSKKNSGKIFLQVEKNGEAWYVSPTDNKRYFLGRPDDAFRIMRSLGLGITNSDINQLPINPSYPDTSYSEPSFGVSGESSIVKIYPKVKKIKVATSRFNPSVSYSPGGDLRIFYNDNDDYIYTKVKKKNEDDFSLEQELYKNQKWGSALYDNGEIKEVALSGDSLIVILETKDNGESWDFVKSYSATETSFTSSWHPVYITGDSNNALVAFGYNKDTHLFGTYSEIFVTKKTNGVWENSTKELGLGEPDAIYRYDNKIIIPSDRGIHYSDDNGENYRVIEDDNTIPELLRPTDITEDGNRIYMVRNYSYGPIGNDQNLSFTYSDDQGATWIYPQIKIMTVGYYFKNTQIIAEDGNVLIAWEKMGDADSLKAILSTDSGKNWGEVFDIVKLEDGDKMVGGEFKIINNDEAIAIAYTVEKEGDKEIYLVEYLK